MKTYNEDKDSGVTMSTTKRFKGFDATFGTDPDEIYIELRIGSPAYIHVGKGDLLQEGDAFHREQLGLASPTLATWEVVEITPETVVVRDIESGEELTMEREEVEKGLAVGRYSTNLTDFEWISVYQVGDWDEYNAEDPIPESHGEPYVSVVAYGDNGLKYGRRYRFVEPESNELVLWKSDLPDGGFSDEVAARLDRRVKAALNSENYILAEAQHRSG